MRDVKLGAPPGRISLCPHLDTASLFSVQTVSTRSKRVYTLSLIIFAHHHPSVIAKYLTAQCHLTKELDPESDLEAIPAFWRETPPVINAGESLHVHGIIADSIERESSYVRRTHALSHTDEQKCDAIKPTCTNCQRHINRQANASTPTIIVCTWDAPRRRRIRQMESQDEDFGAKRAKMAELEGKIGAFLS